MNYRRQLLERHQRHVREPRALAGDERVLSIADYDARQRLRRWRNEYRIRQWAARKGVAIEEALRIANKCRQVHRHMQNLDRQRQSVRNALRLCCMLAAAFGLLLVLAIAS